MLKDKGMVANPDRFAGDYEEWTDWDGPRAPPFRPSAGDLYAGFSRADDPRPGRPIPHPAPEREHSLPHADYEPLWRYDLETNYESRSRGSPYLAELK